MHGGQQLTTGGGQQLLTTPPRHDERRKRSDAELATVMSPPRGAEQGKRQFRD